MLRVFLNTDLETSHIPCFVLFWSSKPSPNRLIYKSLAGSRPMMRGKRSLLSERIWKNDLYPSLIVVVFVSPSISTASTYCLNPFCQSFSLLVFLTQNREKNPLIFIDFKCAKGWKRWLRERERQGGRRRTNRSAETAPHPGKQKQHFDPERSRKIQNSV